jgi:hypothetical protein
MGSPRERTGVITIRVWMEGLAEGSLRARITAVPDLDASEAETRVASTENEIVVAVREFLREFVHAT